MLKYLGGYAATAIVFLALDACWLMLAGPRLYQPLIGQLLAEKVSLGPAIAFYLIYVAAVVALAIAPAIAHGDWKSAAIKGAIFGAAAYATYDLTNQATMKIWSTKITLADIAWGAFVTTVAATAGYYATRRLAGR